jgi:dTDP-4-amino-4,6-dideoxygalactose transaminase
MEYKEMKIPFSKVDCSGNEQEYVNEVIKSGWLTTGVKSKEFENKFSEIVGAKHALAVNSCTAGLHLALDALGIKSGDKVFVPSLTFAASAEVITYFNAIPIFLDIDYSTGLISPHILESALEEHPDAKALIIVHYAGQSAQMFSDSNSKGVIEICKEANIPIVEDAAHAFPSRCGNQYVGAIGDITCFSFYANKTITTGEGGMITTDHDWIAERIKNMRLHGINRDAWNRFTSDPRSWEYDIVDAGYKYNISDLASAIGLAQLERFHEMRDARQKIAEFYLDQFKGLVSIDTPLVRESKESHSWHIFHLVLNEESKVSREDLFDFLEKKGIGFSVHYKPLHRMTYYKDTYNLSEKSFPNTEKFWQGCFSIPIYPALTLNEQKYIAESIKGILK